MVRAVNYQDLQPVIDWAVAFFGLDRSDGLRSGRRSELEQWRMPGLVMGGIHGFSDPNLASVYGQIVLRLPHAIAEVPGADGR